MPQVSVIIPVYNTEEYLEDCLRSVQNQTFADFEAIVINDGSTDGSEEIIHRYVESDPRFILINQDNAGPSEARNAGLRTSQAPWITFVDSDDMIVPNFIERMIKLANNPVINRKLPSSDIVCCGSRKFTETPASIPAINAGNLKLWKSEDALAQALYQDKVPDYSAWNKLYARSLWEGISFPKGKYFEDLATIPQIFKKARFIASTNAKLYLYRIREDSILRTEYTTTKAELLNIAENVLDRIKIDESSDNSKLVQAGENTVISASFSILMRTAESTEFSEVRKRAWNHIRQFRWSNLWNTNVRFRNKAVILASYCGYSTLIKFLKRFR